MTARAVTDMKTMAKRDVLRRQRDLALREIGDSEAQGRRQLAERSKLARDKVYADFNKAMKAVT